MRDDLRPMRASVRRRYANAGTAGRTYSHLELIEDGGLVYINTGDTSSSGLSVGLNRETAEDLIAAVRKVFPEVKAGTPDSLILISEG